LTKNLFARRTAGLGQRVSISSQESAKGQKRERTGEGEMNAGWQTAHPPFLVDFALSPFRASLQEQVSSFAKPSG
jgi:hypothetical protein